MKKTSLEEKFWKFTKKTAHCWLWIGKSLSPAGYGYIREFKKTNQRVHRLSWIIHKGKIPRGMCVLHNCYPKKDNPLCVNPQHLWIGTQSQNMQDMASKGTRKGEVYSKLLKKQVKWIKKYYRPGYGNVAKIARKFHVATSTICDITHKRTWIHI